VKPPDERRQNVRIQWMVSVVWPVKVRGITEMKFVRIAVVALAHDYTRDLASAYAHCRFELAGKQAVFRHGLRCKLRIDAGRPQKSIFLTLYFQDSLMIFIWTCMLLNMNSAGKCCWHKFRRLLPLQEDVLGLFAAKNTSTAC